jgi:2-polyprenyl-3-methyl-5-hydroxy-6-metoxy-1,4-benzoquinol methylase
MLPMDVLTALKNFERHTGKPVAVLDDEIHEYGTTAQEIIDGRVETSRFLIADLADILSKQFKIEIAPFDEEAEWDFLYRMMEESPAFRQYCQQAHASPLIQINELDNETLEQMLALLQLKQTNRVIDIGCGNGYLTEFISDRTQAHIVGIDLSPYAIRLATERTKHKRDRLAFLVGNINEGIRHVFSGYPGVDTIIALEVLYAANNLQTTIGELATLLPPKGQMLFIANQHIEQHGTQGHRLSPDKTDIAPAIKGQNLPLKVYDLTQNKLRFLERSISLLEQYKAVFEQEGNRDFWAGRMIYDRKMLKRVQDGLTRRFLYYVPKEECA